MVAIRRVKCVLQLCLFTSLVASIILVLQWNAVHNPDEFFRNQKDYPYRRRVVVREQGLDSERGLQDFLNLDKSSPDLLKEATASHVDHHSTFIPDSTNRGTERDAHTIVVENPDSNLPNAEEKLTKSSSSTVSSQDPNQQLNGHFVPSSGNAETPTASDAPQEMWPGIGSDRTGTKSKQPHPVHSHSHMHWEKYPWTPEMLGQLNVHIWQSWCGSTTHDLRRHPFFPRYPDVRLNTKKLFITHSELNYGQRVFGYVHPPVTGNYTFAMSSDDSSELWLSADENPVHVRLVAWVGNTSALTGVYRTHVADFTKYGNQLSRPIPLRKGQKYFLEVLHKQARGQDHLLVGWRLPGQRRFRQLTNSAISLFVSDSVSKDVTVYAQYIPEDLPSHSHGPFAGITLNRQLHKFGAPDPRDLHHKASLIDEADIAHALPSCAYKPSYLVTSRLERYEGVNLIHDTAVYPDDHSDLKHMREFDACAKRRLVDSHGNRVPDGPARGLVSNHSLYANGSIRVFSLRGELAGAGGELLERQLDLMDMRRAADTGRAADTDTRRAADTDTRRAADTDTRRAADMDTRRAADTRRTGDMDTRRVADTRRTEDTDTRRAADTRRTEDTDTRRAADTRRTEDTDTRRVADTRRTEDTDTRRVADTRRTEDTDTRRAADTRRTEDTDTRRAARPQPTAPPTASPAKLESVKFRSLAGNAAAAARGKLGPKKHSDGIPRASERRDGGAVASSSRSRARRSAEPAGGRVARQLSPRKPVRTAGREHRSVAAVKSRKLFSLSRDRASQSAEGTGEKKSTRRGGGSASATRSDVAGRREDRVEESDGGRKTSSEAGRSRPRPFFENNDGPLDKEDARLTRVFSAHQYVYLMLQSIQTYDMNVSNAELAQRVWRRFGVRLNIPDVTHMVDSSKWLFSQNRTHCTSDGNLRLHPQVAKSVARRVLLALNRQNFGKYSLKSIFNVEENHDVLHGDRYLVEIDLNVRGQNSSVRLSRYVYQKIGSTSLCQPAGFQMNPHATVHIIVPVKNQGKWVQFLIDDLSQLYQETRDPHFNLIIVDFESEDINITAALERSSLPRFQVKKLRGAFQRAYGIQAGARLVRNPNDIIFMCDLHLKMPSNLINVIRKHCVKGKMAFAPIVARLHCGFTPSLPYGFWELEGYGLFAMYKSDFDRVGGMNIEEFGTTWGGEDWELLDRVLEWKLEVERLRVPKFYHFFHSKQGMWGNANEMQYADSEDWDEDNASNSDVITPYNGPKDETDLDDSYAEILAEND